MKCVYHPLDEGEERCSQCNIPLCKACYTEASLDHEGKCIACVRQDKIVRLYTYFRYGSCGLGIAWVVVAVILFGGGNIFTGLQYGLIGIVAAMLLNFLMAFVLTRMFLTNLEPHQKTFVGLSRYAITGNNLYLNQALKAYDKVETMEDYQEALFQQITAIVILRPNDLPIEWGEHLAEKFKLDKKALYEGLIEYGQDMFEENILNQDQYQAMEKYIDLIEETGHPELYHKLVDDILERLETVDLEAVNMPMPTPMPGQQQTMRQAPSVIRDRALLTELTLIDAELEEFLIGNDREKDYNKIREILDQFDLPKVPKGTFDAAKALAMGGAQQQQQIQAQQTSPPKPKQQTEFVEQIDFTKPKVSAGKKKKKCAECGETFLKSSLQDYEYKDITVSVCNECLVELEADGHRKPKLLSKIIDDE